MIEGNTQRMIAEAWWNEHMRRQRRLSPLTKYIKPRKEEKTAEERREEYQDLLSRLG